MTRSRLCDSLLSPETLNSCVPLRLLHPRVRVMARSSHETPSYTNEKGGTS